MTESPLAGQPQRSQHSGGRHRSGSVGRTMCS